MDTDNDGMIDDWEITKFDNLSRDCTGDYDSDGLTDRKEYQNGTNPKLADTDGDDLDDGDEVDDHVTNPLLADTDEDGMPDG